MNLLFRSWLDWDCLQSAGFPKSSKFTRTICPDPKPPSFLFKMNQATDMAVPMTVGTLPRFHASKLIGKSPEGISPTWGRFCNKIHQNALQKRELFLGNIHKCQVDIHSLAKKWWRDLLVHLMELMAHWYVTKPGSVGEKSFSCVVNDRRQHEFLWWSIYPKTNAWNT